MAAALAAGFASSALLAAPAAQLMSPATVQPPAVAANLAAILTA